MNDKLNILFLGDAMLGENVYHLGRGIRTKYGKDFSNMIPSGIKEELLKDIDAVIYNFEYSLAPDDFDFTDFENAIYASTVASLDVLPNNIVRIVNIANNHFCERGVGPTKYTIDALKEKGFIIVGETREPTIVEIKGKRLYIWGSCLVDKYDLVYSTNYETLLKDIILPPSKEVDDVWIMSLHWGTEFITYPNKEQVDLAHQLVDRGFDIIYGHHPHVFQPIEEYNNGFIMYSMGNFLFDENFSQETQKSYCLKVKIDKGCQYDCLVIRNRKYRPYNIKKIDGAKIKIIPGKYWSAKKKRNTFRKYGLLRKLEYLPHIADNNFLVLKSMKKRKK